MVKRKRDNQKLQEDLMVKKWQNDRQHSMSLNSNYFGHPDPVYWLMSSQILSLTKEVRVLVWFLWFEGSKQGSLRCLAVARKTNIRLGTAWTGTEEKTEVAMLKHSSGWGCLDHCVQLWSIRLTEERLYDERPASFPAPETTKQPRLL